MSTHEAEFKKIVQAQLLHAAEHALIRAYLGLRHTSFDNELSPATLEIRPLGRRLGAWTPATRTITLDQALVFERPWGVVLEVLKHEMAHQYCHEVLGLPEEQHGAAFAQVCAERGIDAASAGLPEVSDPGAEATPPAVLRRIQNLLALAESPELHEAEAAMAKATQLMREYNVQVIKDDAQRRFESRQLGPVMARMPLHLKALAGILGEHFFVYAILAIGYDPKSCAEGRYIEITGTPENLEMAHYVYDFLTGVGERLWLQAAAKGLRGERERQRFLAGLLSGFSEKLRRERAQSESTGLVWVGDPRLAAWIDQRHPHRRKGRSSSTTRTAAYDAGREEGGRLVLHKPITSSAAHGRALTDGRG
jgi:hypothetical protein